MNNKEAIKEINQHIKDSLEEWSDILLEADYNGWAVDLTQRVLGNNNSELN